MSELSLSTLQSIEVTCDRYFKRIWVASNKSNLYGFYFFYFYFFIITKLHGRFGLESWRFLANPDRFGPEFFRPGRFLCESIGQIGIGCFGFGHCRIC